jgi:hypothetical protein
MNTRVPVFRTALALVLAAALAGCAKDPLRNLSDEAARKQAIETLLGNQEARADLVARLVGAPADRAVVLERLLADDSAKADLAAKLVADDRGKAIVVGAVVADDKQAKTFIRMLMTTGAMGASLTQRQADALGQGEAYAYGNRRRSMFDLKHLGTVVDEWARNHEGRYPKCASFDDVAGCLTKSLPKDTLASLRAIDAWGAPYQYRTNQEGTEYVLVSYATDGMYDGLGKVGPTDGLDCDIVFSNGQFVQWPGSFRPEDVK